MYLIAHYDTINIILVSTIFMILSSNSITIHAINHTCHVSNFHVHGFDCIGANNNCSLLSCASPCFQVWDSKGNHISAGCGVDPHPSEKPCGLSCEAERKPGNAGYFYCCCTGDLCNQHLPELPESLVSAAAAAYQSNISTQSVVTHEGGTPSSRKLFWWWWLIPTLFVTSILASLFIYKKRLKRKQNSFHEEDNQLNQPMMMQMLTAAAAANQFGNNHHYANNNNNNTNHSHHHLPNYHPDHNNHLNKNYNHHHYHHYPNQYPQNIETDLNETKIDLNTLKLLEVLGQGRFGMVHRAHIIMNNQKQDDNNGTGDSEQIDSSKNKNKVIVEPKEVAVKVIKIDEYDSWQNERYIYRSYRIKHPNILNYFYSSEHVESNTYWLIVEYAPLGSLCSYLKENTLRWEHFVDIVLGIVRGLNHLHDVQIAHRDFKSSNILLKKDLTPCITDFGVAKKFDSPNGPVMDQKKYHQVGTPRYMAPEVLECNIVFTTSSIMKIDVYALSLVLWEVLSRTILLPQPIANHNDNDNNNDDDDDDDDEYTPPPFMLPFEDVAGQKPSIAKMVQIVVQEKQRPPIRQEWINQPRLSDFCRSVLREGWDTDFDSRISASCLLERVKIFVDRERSVSKNELQ